MKEKAERTSPSSEPSLPPNLDSAIDRCSNPVLLRTMFCAFEIDTNFKDTRNFVDALNRHLDVCMKINCLKVEILDEVRNSVDELKNVIDVDGPRFFPRTLDLQGGRRNANELIKYSSARLLTCEPQKEHRQIHSFLVGFLIVAISEPHINVIDIRKTAKASRISLDPIFSENGKSAFTIEEGKILAQLVQASSIPIHFLSLSKIWLGSNEQYKKSALAKVLNALLELFAGGRITRSQSEKQKASFSTLDVSEETFFTASTISHATEEDSLPLASIISHAPTLDSESFKPETSVKIMVRRSNSWLHSVVDVFVDSREIYNRIERIRAQKYSSEVLKKGDRYQRIMALLISIQIYLAKDRNRAIACTWGSSATAELHSSGQWLRPNPMPDGAFTPEDEDTELYEIPVSHFYLKLPSIVQDLLASFDLPRTEASTLGELLKLSPSSIDADVSEFVEEMRNATACPRLRLNGFTNQLVKYTVAKTNRNTAYWIFGGDELGAPMPAYYAASDFKKLSDAYILLAQAYARGDR